MFRFLLCLLLFASMSWGDLPPPQRPYKILMLLPISSKSHRNVFMPLANALVDRGHEVTMVSNNDLEHPKIKHFRHGLREFDVDSYNMFELGRNPDVLFKKFEVIFPVIASKIYNDPVVKDLYSRRKEFDLIVINGIFNNAIYPFGHDHTFIFLSTGGIDPVASAASGNLLNPAYTPNILDNYKHPFSFIDRVKNVFFSMAIPLRWRKSINAPTQNEISKRFPDIPSLLEIEANASLTLMNSHFSMGKPTPLLPNQVEVGGMHCRPAKPLPEDIEKFLSGNTPVVYMSLGSVARSETMPAEYKKIIIEAFSKLPYKVLWKYEDMSISLPKNVMIKSWMPQQDVVAHPNVKVFISHCGLLGTQEAMYHGTPMVGLPIFGDQPKNGKGLEFAGVGKMLVWETLTVKKLTDAIHEVVSNPKYREKMAAISAAFRDQLESPVERAVYWTEYVIRHQGAVHLRSPELDLSWIQLLHLDILLAAYLVLYVTLKILKALYNICFSFKKSRKQGKGKYKGD